MRPSLAGLVRRAGGGEGGEIGGSVAFGQRGAAAGHRVAREDRPHSGMENADTRPAFGPLAQRRWRWARGPCRTWRRTSRGFRLSDGLLSILGKRARSKRLRLWTVRGKLHRRGSVGPGGLRRRPLPSRRRVV